MKIKYAKCQYACQMHIGIFAFMLKLSKSTYQIY